MGDVVNGATHAKPPSLQLKEVSDKLKAKAVEELRGIDHQNLFWVDIAVATADGASSDDVDWEEFDWAAVRAQLDEWLPTLDADTLDPAGSAATLTWPAPGRDDVLLVARARARSREMRGNTRYPSLAIADPEEIPELQFRDGTSGSLYALSIETVRDLATGEQALAIELPSHRATWLTLLEEMQHFGYGNTSEIARLLLEPTASALGFVAAPDELGDFDETWRAINRVDFPIENDPRDLD